MAPLIVIAVALILFVGFITLTAYETRVGIRFFSTKRGELDRFAERIFFFAKHIDFMAFARHTAHQMGEYIAHQVAHLSLLAVRATERLLTRVVRTIRARQARRQALAPSKPASSFIHSITNFKKNLKKPEELKSDSVQTEESTSV